MYLNCRLQYSLKGLMVLVALSCVIVNFVTPILRQQLERNRPNGQDLVEAIVLDHHYQNVTVAFATGGPSRYMKEVHAPLLANRKWRFILPELAGDERGVVRNWTAQPPQWAPEWISDQWVSDDGRWHYGSVRAKASCIDCHKNVTEGDLVAIVQVEL